MARWNLSGYALSVSVAAMLLSACGGSQPPIGAPGAMPQNRTITTHAERGGSWMLPEAKSEDLLYVSDWYPANNVTVYSYLRHKLVGTLTGFSFPAGLCTDKSGDVFVANEDGNDVLEYPHGGAEPIESLTDSDAPIGCSIDPTTGNLAVANAGYVQGPSGSLYVYKNATGAPTKYTDGYYLYHFYSCVYDSDGNLFVDGSGVSSSGVAFAELPKGASGFTNIQLSPKIKHDDLPTGLGWDGKHVTYWSGGLRNVIYRLTIKGDRAFHRHFTSLEQGYPDGSYWIVSDRRGQTLIGADNIQANQIVYWNYPAGGDPIAKIKDGVEYPVAVTVSLAGRL